MPSSCDPAGIDRLKQGGCVAVAHHGEVTDNLFKQGKIDDIHDYLKRVRDAGMLVGVSTRSGAPARVSSRVVSISALSAKADPVSR